MIRMLLNVLMVWLLIGPPALCRAGVLVDCCDHEPLEAQAPSAAVQPPCCANDATGCDNDQPAPEPMPRKCGTCAGVCVGVAKPTDGSKSATLAMALIHPLYFASDAPIALRTSADTACCRHQLGLPYPPSDLPLLI